MQFSSVLTLITLMLLMTGLKAQFGPAGVGSQVSNGLWLRADVIQQANGSAVSFWPDSSGNQNNAVRNVSAEQPKFYKTSNINAQPIVRFDGNNDQMLIADNPILDGTSSITFYAVIRPNNLDNLPRGILGKRITYKTQLNYAYSWFFWTGKKLYLDVHTNNNRFNSGSTTFSNSKNYILSWDFDGSLNPSKRSRIRASDDVIETGYENSTSLPNSNQDLVLGALNYDYSSFLGADYAEIIHFNYALSNIEHIILQNYLSAKYDIPLNNHDIYVQDNPGNGDYDFDVAGIGHINGTDIQNDAKGSGILRINNPSDLDNNEFLFWGHDGGVQEAIDFSDVPSTVDARFERVWRFSEVNSSGAAVDVGMLDLTFDLSGLMPINANDLKLLIDTDNDAKFSDESPIGGAVKVGSGLYKFYGVSNISNNTRLTLATSNSGQTPLPVSLLDFEATLIDNNKVRLFWRTTSEINSDYFTIEHSYDGASWQEIGKVEGAGNSNHLNQYQFIDQNPFEPITYYRLKQSDFNGAYRYIDELFININNNSKKLASLYPNPSTGMVSLEVEKVKKGDIRLFNITGQDVTNQLYIQRMGINKFSINLEKLNPSIYLLKTNVSSHRLILTK